MDTVGLNIGRDDERCEKQCFPDGEQCELQAGHPGPHNIGTGTELCPDCDEPVVEEFSVDAPNEETALRVFLSFYAMKEISMDMLKRVSDGNSHVHIVEGNCDDEST